MSGRRRRHSSISGSGSGSRSTTPEPEPEPQPQPAAATEADNNDPDSSGDADYSGNEQGILIPIELEGERVYMLEGTNIILRAEDLQSLGLDINPIDVDVDPDADPDADPDSDPDPDPALDIEDNNSNSEYESDNENNEGTADDNNNPTDNTNPNQLNQSGMELFAQSIRSPTINHHYPINLYSHLQYSHQRSIIGMNSYSQSIAASHFIPNKQIGITRFGGRNFCGKFSSTGEIFCSATQDGFIHFYSTDQWIKTKQIQAHDVGWSIIDIDYSPDERYLIYSSWSNCIRLVNVSGSFELHEELDLIPESEGHSHTCMFGIKFNPLNTEILSGLNGGNLILYDIERKQPLCNISGHSDDINSVCYLDSTGNLFASGSDDNLIRIWDRRLLPYNNNNSNNGSIGQSSVGAFIGHSNGLTCVTALSSSAAAAGNYLLSNSKDQSMKLWDCRLMSTSTAADNYLHSNQSNRQRDYRWNRIIRSSATNHRLAEDTSICTYTGHSIAQTLIRCDFSPIHSTNNRYVYSGSADGFIYIYDSLTGELVSKLGSNNNYNNPAIIRDVSWHPFKCELVSASWDGAIRRYGYVTKKPRNSTTTAATTATIPESEQPQQSPDYELVD